MLALGEFVIEFSLLPALLAGGQGLVIARGEALIGAASQNQNFVSFATVAGDFAIARILTELGALLLGVVLTAFIVSPIALDGAADDIEGIGGAFLRRSAQRHQQKTADNTTR